MLADISNFIRVRFSQLTKILYLLATKKKTVGTDYKHILFLRKDGIGDAVMFMPSFRALKKKFPSSDIDLVNFKGFDRVLDAEKEVNVIKRPFLHLCSCILKGQRYDQMIIFSGGRELHLLKWFEKYRSIHVVTNTQIYSGENCVDFYLRLSEMCFGKLEHFNSSTRLTIINHEKTIADNILCENKILDSKKIGIVVGSTVWWKNYPHWDKLINCLKLDTELKHYRICLFGGKNGTAEALRLRSKYEYLLDFTGLSLREAMAMACDFDLIICADSGFMHVANALKVKTLAVFGATSPLCLTRLGRTNKILAIVWESPCRPCYEHAAKFSCNNNLKCMDIPAERLLETAKKIVLNEADFEKPLIIHNNHIQ